MRIVQIVANLEMGGLERQAIELAAEQAQSGHDPHIYCLFQPGSLAEEANSRGIPTTAFHKPSGFSWRTVKQMTRQLDLDRPDVIHTHNAVVHHYGVVAAKRAGVRRVINTQHGTSTFATDRRLAKIFSVSLRWTDAVVVVSEEVRRLLVRDFGISERKTRVIRNGIRLSQFESFQAKPGSRWPKLRFGTAGRLAPAKDHRTLVAALSRVLAEMPCAELHIAGDGPLQNELRAQIDSLGLNQNVHLHGVRKDIGAFLSDLDIFVLSSVSEGLPLALLEATAAGLPVVSTRVGGVGEIGAAALAEYCEPNRPQALADAMLRMGRKTDLAEIGSRSRELAACHDIGHTWSQYEDLLRALDK